MSGDWTVTGATVVALAAPALCVVAALLCRWAWGAAHRDDPNGDPAVTVAAAFSGPGWEPAVGTPTRRQVAHRDGVPWWEAAPPPQVHVHYPQTRGLLAGGEPVVRCACGATGTVDGWRPARDPRVGRG